MDQGGRDFLNTPGPTHIPDRVLNAMKTSVILILLGHLPMVFVVTFFPDIALWLPRILMGT